MRNEEERIHEPPVQELREGAVKAALWRREGRNGVFYQVSFTRIYRDATTGEWCDCSSFGERDLESLARVAAQSYSWITMNADTMKGGV